ncbi:hypothetical protein Slin15195_G108930 [Septoria linicola]|uniref:Uncharacterized protein n=1 Tax=Septoria linicola TaxID=215465 RepID=A0A9Q9AY60_9PEZI|nr:hypothetical protein Slin14017_G107270 [Septoria linicola]USW57574.1 hypothetical protein Slin15195_G108930 [Septoria linicola]
MAAPSSGVDEHVKSHRGRLRGRNKKQDPFLELPDDVVKQTTQASAPYPSEDGHSSSLIADLIFTPLSVISFILSLLVVERQQRQWRYQNHAQPSQATSGSWFTSPEPYQDASGATWHPRLSWRRRGIAKVQINEVLEMRGRVVLSIVVWMALGLLALAYGSRRLYSWSFA